MSTYTCQFAGETIDASLYDVIDFGEHKVGHFEYTVSNNTLYITSPSNLYGSAKISNWNTGNVQYFTYGSYTYVDSVETHIVEKFKIIKAGELTSLKQLGLEETYMAFGDSGENVINLKGGKGLILYSMEGNDTITWTGTTNEYVEIMAGSGADKVSVDGGNNVSVTGGDDDDFISLNNTVNVQDTSTPFPDTSYLRGDAGDDTITVTSSAYVDVYGDSGYNDENATGNDRITLVNSKNVSVDGQNGNDTVTDIGGSNVSAYGGADDDVLRAFNTSTISMNGGDGADILTVYGGNNITMSGGAGDDTYKIMSAITADTDITIKQSDAGQDDNDRLVLAKVSKNDISTVLDSDGNLVITHAKNGGKLTVKGWDNCAISKLVFKDGVIRADSVVQRTTVLENGSIIWHANSINNTLTFQGGVCSATVYNANASSVIDVSGLLNSGQDDFITTCSGNDLIVTTSKDSGNQSTLIFADYFLSPVALNFMNGSNPYAYVTSGTENADTIDLNIKFKDQLAAGYGVVYLGLGGADTISVSSGFYYVKGGDGDDIININGSNSDNSIVDGGQGSDAYNVTWTEGYKWTIDTREYVEGDKDTVKITNMVASDFQSITYETDDYGVNSLKLYDKSGGRLKIQLVNGLMDSPNFAGIEFKDGFVASENLLLEHYEINNQQSGESSALHESEYQGTNGVDIYDLYGYVQGYSVSGANGNDVFNVYGTTSDVPLNGGAGNDSYSLKTSITADTNIVIDQSGAAEEDADTLTLEQVGKDEVTFEVNDGNLLLQHDNGGQILVNGWSNHALSSIMFKDGALDLTAINARIELDKKGETILLNGSGNTITTGKKDDHIYNGYDDYENTHDNSISTGAGDDIVELYGYRNTIDTGDGDDEVSVLFGWGSYFPQGTNIINTGLGNDILYISDASSQSFIINTGEDDDVVIIDSSEASWGNCNVKLGYGNDIVACIIYTETGCYGSDNLKIDNSECNANDVNKVVLSDNLADYKLTYDESNDSLELKYTYLRENTGYNTDDSTYIYYDEEYGPSITISNFKKNPIDSLCFGAAYYDYEDAQILRYNSNINYSDLLDLVNNTNGERFTLNDIKVRYDMLSCVSLLDLSDLSNLAVNGEILTYQYDTFSNEGGDMYINGIEVGCWISPSKAVFTGANMHSVSIDLSYDPDKDSYTTTEESGYDEYNGNYKITTKTYAAKIVMTGTENSDNFIGGTNVTINTGGGDDFITIDLSQAKNTVINNAAKTGSSVVNFIDGVSAVDYNGLNGLINGNCYIIEESDGSLKIGDALTINDYANSGIDKFTFTGYYGDNSLVVITSGMLKTIENSDSSENCYLFLGSDYDITLNGMNENTELIGCGSSYYRQDQDLIIKGDGQVTIKDYFDNPYVLSFGYEYWKPTNQKTITEADVQLVVSMHASGCAATDLSTSSVSNDVAGFTSALTDISTSSMSFADSSLSGFATNNVSLTETDSKILASIVNQ